MFSKATTRIYQKIHVESWRCFSQGEKDKNAVAAPKPQTSENEDFPMFWNQLMYTVLSIKPCFRLDLCALPLSDTFCSRPLWPDSLESVLVISWYPNTCPSEAPRLFSLYSSGGGRPFAWLHCQSCPACYQDVILLFLLPHNYFFWSPSPSLYWASPRPCAISGLLLIL